MHPKTRSNIFETIELILLAAVILIGIFWATDYQRFNDLEVELAVQEALINELEKTVVESTIRIANLENKEVLLITNTGKEIVIETMDGQTLRCYFPE